jgi:aspartate/methionine/tyrosine aminotransferase
MLARVGRIQSHLTEAWETLATMTPADYLRFRSLATLYAPENVVVAPGAKRLLRNLFAVLLDPGDEVVFADPAYPA